MVQKKLPKYAGDKSKTFWKRVNAIKGVRGDILYGMGVMLQAAESTYLHAEWNMMEELEAAEKRQRR